LGGNGLGSVSYVSYTFGQTNHISVEGLNDTVAQGMQQPDKFHQWENFVFLSFRKWGTWFWLQCSKGGWFSFGCIKD